MGYLAASGYAGTERINLANGYWVEIKKCLSSAEAAFCEAAMMPDHRLADGAQSSTLDQRAYRTEMVVQSLVAWNLDDDDGTVWSLEAGQKFSGPGKNPYPPQCPRRHSVARVAEPDFERIFQRCDELNSPRKGSEAASFPDGAERGDQDGNGSAADPGPVPDGAGVLDPAGVEPGDAAAAPAP